jgi:pimeloyl-ACP methyl ester carboxylesterase
MAPKIHTLVNLVLWCVCLYLIYLCFLFLIQRRLVFPRHLALFPQTQESIPGLEKSWIRTDDGPVETWFLPPAAEDTPYPVIIFAHGNAELIDYSPKHMTGLVGRGIGVLLVEYPGYGRSDGSPSQKAITEVFLTAYDNLIARENVDPARIILMGHSLGGGVACALAGQRPSAALILLSTFTSIRALSSRYFSPGFLVRDPFENLDVVSRYTHPIHISHGEQDGIIPYSHALALSQAGQDARLVTYQTGHNDCPPNWGAYWDEVIRFLEDIEIIPRSG